MKKGRIRSLEAEATEFAGLHPDAIMRVMASVMLFIVGSLMAVVIMKANVAAVMIDESATHLEANALRAAGSQ